MMEVALPRKGIGALDRGMSCLLWLGEVPRERIVS